MSFAGFYADLDLLEDLLRQLKLKPPASSAYNVELALAREHQADMALPEGARVAKWKPRITELVHAMAGFRRLTQAAVALKNQPGKQLRSILKDIIAGSVRQDFSPQTGKDKLYELEIAFELQNAGFDVELREPDVVLSGNGLSQQLGVACKYPASAKQLHEHLNKGYDQLDGQGLNGVVSIGMDQLVYKDQPNNLDFREAADPAQVVQEALTKAVRELVEERARDYPAEKSADGLLLTMRVWGAFGKPVAITGISALTLQCDANNPIHDDLQCIYDALRAVQNIQPANP